MDLTWGTCKGGLWCGFLTVNLNLPYFDGKEGVYIIWQDKGPIIRIGQGIIRDMSVHRNDREIIAYPNLLVTWAVVPVQHRRGVERFLSDRLNPRVGDHPMVAAPIEVNLPWPY